MSVFNSLAKGAIGEIVHKFIALTHEVWTQSLLS